MKHFTHFSILVFIFVLISLAACKTMRTSEKAVSESETAAVTASRLTFYRSLDALSRQLTLSADSISIIFLNECQEFPADFPSEKESWSETPSDSLATQAPKSLQRPRDAARPVLASPSPKFLHIYGLHLGASTKEKSVTTTDLKDSVATATQSQKLKSATKQSSHPSSTPTILVVFSFILALIFIICSIMKKRFH